VPPRGEPQLLAAIPMQRATPSNEGKARLRAQYEELARVYVHSRLIQIAGWLRRVGARPVAVSRHGASESVLIVGVVPPTLNAPGSGPVSRHVSHLRCSIGWRLLGWRRPWTDAHTAEIVLRSPH
jgi:hypothetical protein